MQSARRAMGLICDERIRAILRTLAGGPASPSEITERLLVPSPATLHSRLSALREAQAIARRRRRAAPLAVAYELTRAGRDLLAVCDVAARWVRCRPADPLDPRGQRASKALSALADGWAAAILQQLSCAPRALSQLELAIPVLTHYARKGRLGRLVDGGIVVPLKASGPGRPFDLTAWGRRGVSVLAAAARWEHAHLAEHTTPVSIVDAQAAALISLPLAEVDERAEGTCELIFEPERDGAGPVIAHATYERGAPVAFAPGSGPKPSAWVRGTISDWFSAILDNRASALSPGGERSLALDVVAALHRGLYVWD